MSRECTSEKDCLCYYCREVYIQALESPEVVALRRTAEIHDCQGRPDCRGCKVIENYDKKLSELKNENTKKDI